ncbi:XRE family transcriptional regulator [Streptomyces melanogenes]|uniref:XRE family transcriptional regulator n=1 Tax=Streptomyces melanogenes TaxID=67326 RepID=A0ABZ1XGZ2_9ACTN|nr:XRE family transcriptional regulator [Streptomyces melanogenes]
MDERETRRSGYPLTIPDALLRSEAMQQACSVRDFREIFRLVNRRTGSSHAAMAAAIGKMTSSRVSDIIRGVRGVRGREVIERVADGFGIPGEMIGLPRRPWEGSEQEVVSPVDRRTLFKEGSATGAMTGADHEEIQHVAAALEDAYRYLDGPVVDYFRKRLEVAKHDDGAMGARRTLPLVLGLLSAVEQRARDVKPAVRRELLSVGADGAEFAGWLYRDIQQPAIAVFWYDRAVEWAQEANDPAMQGYMLLKKSQMAYDDGDAGRILTLAQAGQHERWRLPPRVQAELLQQEALGCAMTGEPFSLVEQRLSAARELLAHAAGSEPSGLGAYFNEHTLLLRNAVSYTEAGKPGLAADLFGKIIAAGTLSRRDIGFFNARRSAALALSGEPDEAARIGTASAGVARAMKSERTLRVLDEVSQTLSRWRSRPVVREFREALRAV